MNNRYTQRPYTITSSNQQQHSGDRGGRLGVGGSLHHATGSTRTRKLSSRPASPSGLLLGVPSKDD
jgi:hypothetical protein